ncbi:hypothetical protein CEP54_001737 [Fusarium duplospermum]|uniref:Uncharacterized protein n=1 Tax=Fusarium duplospermum TaxID=1325734 RepID=A0A428QZ10_9HYPO|nr:hypothetical protein CEP54_001737 [Fusarium duplospermum]
MSPSPSEREDTPEVVNSPADTIIMDMEPDRQSSHTVEATSPDTSDPEWAASKSLPPHSTWRSTITAMARCDFCQLGSRGTLQQCLQCGVSVCEECFDAGLLDCRHRLDADRVDWNQHNKSRKRISRARSRVTRSSAAVSRRTPAWLLPQERRQAGRASRADTESASNSAPSTPERYTIRERSYITPRRERDGSIAVRDYQGNNGYAPIQPHFTSAVEQTSNNWNYQFNQPPDQHQEEFNGSSTYSGATLASNEDPLSWNHIQPQTEHQYDQMPSSHNGFASSYNGEWLQPIQSSSAYSFDQPAYHYQQGPAANLPMPLPQASSNSWQPHSPPRRSLTGPELYYADLSNYDLASVSVAPASHPRSPNRIRSTPRVMPEFSMPSSPSGYTLQHGPTGPPRRYEDYFHLQQAGAASSQGQGQGSNQPFTNHHLPVIRTTTEADEDNSYDTSSSRQDL